MSIGPRKMLDHYDSIIAEGRRGVRGVSHVQASSATLEMYCIKHGYPLSPEILHENIESFPASPNNMCTKCLVVEL